MTKNGTPRIIWLIIVTVTVGISAFASEGNDTAVTSANALYNTDIVSPESDEKEGIKLSVGGSLRLRFESWQNGDIVPDLSSPARVSAWRDGYNDDYTLTNLKLHLDADITDLWSAFIEIEHASLESSSKINEHRRYKSKLHLQQAFLEYDDSVNRLTLGRQTLDYGSRLIIGTNTWLNNTISYDVLRYDYFSEVVDASFFGGFEAFEPHDDIDVDNLVGGYHLTFRPASWQLEQYMFYKKHDLKAGAKDFDAYSFGTRIMNSWAKYDLDLDLVRQLGDRRGFATHGFFVRHLNPGHWSQTRLFTSFNVASGGKDADDDYIPFSPAGHLDRQSTDFSPYTNLKEYGFGISATPIKNQPLFLRLSWFDMYMYNKHGAIYSFDSNTIVWGKASNIRSNHLGEHVALFASYKIEKTKTVITTCLTKYFIDRAIDQFPNRGDTSFFYLSVTQSF